MWEDNKCSTSTCAFSSLTVPEADVRDQSPSLQLKNVQLREFTCIIYSPHFFLFNDHRLKSKQAWDLHPVLSKIILLTDMIWRLRCIKQHAALSGEMELFGTPRWPDGPTATAIPVPNMWFPCVLTPDREATRASLLQPLTKAIGGDWNFLTTFLAHCLKP